MNNNDESVLIAQEELLEQQPEVGLTNETVVEGGGSEEPEVPVELTDEEKRALKIEALKNSVKTFKPNKFTGKGFTNQFGADYKAKRRKKNKAVKKSRSANRK